jgi:hypothetical protein
VLVDFRGASIYVKGKSGVKAPIIGHQGRAGALPCPTNSAAAAVSQPKEEEVTTKATDAFLKPGGTSQVISSVPPDTKIAVIHLHLAWVRIRRLRLLWHGHPGE